MESLKQATRRYAKRQLTWFRRDPRIRWVCPDGMGGADAALREASEIAGNFLKNSKKNWEEF